MRRLLVLVALLIGVLMVADLAEACGLRARRHCGVSAAQTTVQVQTTVKQPAAPAPCTCPCKDVCVCQDCRCPLRKAAKAVVTAPVKAAAKAVDALTPCDGGRCRLYRTGR